MISPLLTERLIRGILIASVLIFAGVAALIAIIFSRRLKRESDFRLVDLLRSESSALLESLVGGAVSYEVAVEQFREMFRPSQKDAIERIALELAAHPRYASLMRRILVDTGLVQIWRNRLAGTGGEHAWGAENHGREHARLGKSGAVERAKSAENLGRIRDRESWPVLVAALSDASADVRAVALRSLGAIGEPRSFRSVVECLRSGMNNGRPNFSERSARSALAGFPPEVAPELLPVLQDPNPRLREFAAAVLYELLGGGPMPGVLPAPLSSLVSDALTYDPSTGVRAAATRLLGLADAEDGRASRRLAELTADTEWLVRLRAAQSLEARSEPHAIAALSSLMTDPNWRVREAAVHALAQQGHGGMRAAVNFLRATHDVYAAEQLAEEIGRPGFRSGLATGSAESGYEREAEELNTIITGYRAAAAPAAFKKTLETDAVVRPERLSARAGADGRSPQPATLPGGNTRLPS